MILAYQVSTQSWEVQWPMLRMLTDRGTEFCGKAEQHDYELYLVINDIDHTKTKVASPQTNGICERFHKTILQEFYQVIFRKKSIQQWMNCTSILTNGFITLIMIVYIKVRCAVAEHQ